MSLRRLGRLIAGVLLLLLPAPSPARAQPSMDARVTNLAVNAAIGAVLATVRSVVDGRWSARPALLGAVGGALQGAGRQVAAGRSSASGLVGRELSALGISLTYSAGADSVVLIAPAWLVTVEVRPQGARRVLARANAADLALVAAALIRGDRLDIESTLSAGAPVFVLDGPLSAGATPGSVEAGYSRMGVIYIADRVKPSFRRVALSHEAVHLLQWDSYSQLVALPIERELMRRLSGGTLPLPYLDLGVVAPATAFPIAHGIPYERQPWEREAYRLTTGQPTP